MKKTDESSILTAHLAKIIESQGLCYLRTNAYSIYEKLLKKKELARLRLATWRGTSATPGHYYNAKGGVLYALRLLRL